MSDAPIMLWVAPNEKGVWPFALSGRLYVRADFAEQWWRALAAIADGEGDAQVIARQTMHKWALRR